jgi:hypothetical protein
MTPKLPRDIRREHRFEVECAAIDADVRRMDEALRFVEQVLSTTPDFGLSTRTLGIWVAPLVFLDGTSSGAQGASIFYTFDDRVVRLLSIRADF